MELNLTDKQRRYRSYSKENIFPLNVNHPNRNTHNAAINMSVMSEKVPRILTPHGLSFHPLKPQNIQNESKISLYSEIERLSVFNYELKVQSEGLMNQLSMQNHLIRKIPDLEASISNLRVELTNKDESLSRNNEMLHHKSQEIEAMHRDLVEMKNTELINRDLSLQIEHISNDNEKFTNTIRARNHDIEIMKYDVAKLQGAQFTISDLNRNIDMLSNELIGKMRELEEVSFLNQELQNFKIKYAEMQITYEQEKIAHEQGKIAHEHEKIDMKNQHQILKNIQIERELKEANRKFKEERGILEAKLKSTENKMINLGSEIDRIKEKLKERDAQVVGLEEQKRELENHLQNFEKVKVLLSSTTNEIESLRDQISHQEVRHINSLEEHKKMAGNSLENQKKDLEIHLKTIYEYELKDAQARWNQEKAHYEYEVKDAHAKWNQEKTHHEYELKDAQAKWNQEKADLETLLHRYTLDNENLNRTNQQNAVDMDMTRKEILLQEAISKAQLEEQKQKFENENTKEIQNILLDSQKQIEDQLSIYRQRSLDYESRIRTLLEENNHIDILNEDRLKEIEQLKNQISQLEENHENYIKELHKKHEDVKKLAVHKEAKDINDKHNIEIALLESNIFQLNQKLSTNENKFTYLENEIERLKSFLNSKQNELDEQKKKYQNLEINMAQDLDSLRQQFETYKKANIDISTLQIKFEAERTTYQTQIIQLKEKIAQLETRIASLHKENDKINALHTEKMIDIENLKKQYKELEENASQQNSESRAELDNLKKSAFDAKEITIRNSSEKAGYENQIRQLKTMNENGKQELEKLYELMNQRKKEYEGYIKQNEELRKQIEKLTKQINLVDSEFSSKSGKIDSMTKTIQDLEKEKYALQQQVEKQSSEVSKKNKDLSNKIEEIDSLKGKYESAIENYNKLSTQLMGKLMRD